MNDVTAKIAAHLMGDGCVTPRYIRYNNTNETLLKRFKSDITEIFGSNIHFIEGKVNSGTKFVQIQNKKILSKILEVSSTYRSGKIEIPRDILNGNLTIKKSFIRAFFDDEGSVGLRKFTLTGEVKRDIHLASKSKKIVEQIKNILENKFEIKCNKIGKDVKGVNNKKYITWVLRITGRENMRKFKNIIGFEHPEKKKKLNKLLNSYHN